MKDLSHKQKRFIECFEGNGTDAARKAGYKGNSLVLAQVASENLRKPYIQEALKTRTDPFINSVIADRNDRQQFWSAIMTSSDQSMRDRLRASELLAKAQGDFLEQKPPGLSLEAIILAAQPKARD